MTGKERLSRGVRMPGSYGVDLRRAVDWVGFNLRAYSPVVTTKVGWGSRPLSGVRMTVSPPSPLAGGRPAEPYHDAFVSSERLPHPIPGLGGGGRDLEDRWLEDGVNS